MLIKAAINGGRSRVEHAAVPITPEDQATAVVDCLRAGAGAIHQHVRSTTGDAYKESLHSTDVARTLSAVGSVSPEAQIGVSTGAWIVPDAAARFEVVKAWEVVPDFASVNFCEEGAVELADLLLSRNVGVEAGLCAAADAQILLQSGLAKRCCLNRKNRQWKVRSGTCVRSRRSCSRLRVNSRCYYTARKQPLGR